MKKRQLLTMVLAGAMVMGTVGYGTPVLADSEKKDVKLGVSIMELTAYPWFQGVVDGCEQWADENSDEKGVNIKFDFEDSHSDVQTMLTNLDNMQAAGCDGIILFPADASSAIPTMKECVSNGIPVVVGDYPQETSSDSDVVWSTFVGHDMKALGQKAGETAVEYLDTLGKEDPVCLFISKINPEAVIGIRAFRQPPLEKDPAFLKECVDSMPEDIMLFWAPGLYVPESEFEKWCNAFGRDRIWARDTESNSITSTMGRLYRTFASNVIRYEDEANEQVIETDIRQHRGSVRMGVHGINGFMFEWYGLFMHLFAHGNYGWGSQMENEEFYHRACRQNFGDLGETVLYVMRNMVTVHESQIPLYTTPFPFQKNKMTREDIPAIIAAKQNHDNILSKIHMLQKEAYLNEKLRVWLPHFDKLENAERRNAIIYDMVLAALAYEDEKDEKKKEQLLDEILYYNEQDFDIVKEMFFDVNPVTETGVGSCMFPYHEMKRIIHNIRHPEAEDKNVISSGVEAFGWLWL